MTQRATRAAIRHATGLQYDAQCVRQGFESRYNFCIVTGADDMASDTACDKASARCDTTGGGHDTTPSVPRHDAQLAAWA